MIKQNDLAEYYIWRTMKARCLNPKNKKWDRYGGRGIRIYEPWINDFKEFYDYVGPRPSNQHSIDRIDNDGHYEPGNVRWATPEEQVYNRSVTVNVTMPDGRIVTTKEAMEELGLKRGTFYGRLYNNVSLDRPITRSNRILYPYKGEHLPIYKIAKLEGISHRLMYGHIRRDIDLKIAINEVIDYVKKTYYDESGNRIK